MARKGPTHTDWRTPDGLLQIEGWVREGLYYSHIAKNIGVTEGTFRNWVSKYDDISDAVKKGKSPIDFEVENALLKRALGFEYEETETTVEEVAGRATTRIVKRKKYALPDVGAISFWLKNRKPDKWRKTSPEYKSKIEAEIAKLEKEMEKIDMEVALGQMRMEDINALNQQIEMIIVDDWSDEDDSPQVTTEN